MNNHLKSNILDIITKNKILFFVIICALSCFNALFIEILINKKLSIHSLNLELFVKQYSFYIIYTISTFYAFCMIYIYMFIIKRKKESNFSDIYKDKNIDYILLKEIQEVLEANKSLSPDEIKNLIHDTLGETRIEQEESFKKEQTEKFSSFPNYFNTIVIYFSEEAQKANASAAMALDNGKKYAMAGISFLIISIIIWQILYILFGEKPQFIYGMVSCSLLFIFIEFISAWFLKQYKTFVDTATYLMKIKCIFERYMLSYMLIKETNMPPEEYSNLLLSLQDEIKWPETYLLKNADINFAKEAIETMTHMLKNIKDSVQKKDSPPEKAPDCHFPLSML